MTPRALLPALLAVLALAGCSAPAAAAPTAARTIAALPASTAPASPASHSPSLTEQYGTVPRLRLDMSDAESDRAWQPYNTCIAKLGGTPKRIDSSNSAPGLGAAVFGPEMKTAERTCAPLQPKPPWEYDRNNPDALRFVRAVVACLHRHGIPAVVEQPDEEGRIGFGFTGDTQRGLSVAPTCERTVSAR